MATKVQDSNYPYLFLYILIFFTMIFQGGYFSTGLLLLNIGLITYILITRVPIQVDVNLFLLLSLLGIMMISAVFQSVDGYAGVKELLKYSLYPLSYVVFMKIKNQDRVGTIFFQSIMVLMVFGLLGVLGFSLFSGMVTIQGNRLQSFFQYANTTALFMGIGVLFSIQLFLDSRKKHYILLGIFFFVALLLTQSRITLVVFLFILSLYFFRFFRFKVKILFVSSVMIGLGLLFSMGGRIIKISLFEPTFIERIITYQDAAQILFKNLGMGLGVGNWQYMQFAYQSAPYQVRYIHNIFAQVAVDGGVLALLVFSGWILLPLVRGYKRPSIYYYMYLFIVIHSFLEVDFNFGILILFFIYLATRIDEPVYLKNPLPSFKYKYLLIVPLVAFSVLLVSEMIAAYGNTNGNRQEAYRLFQTAYQLNPLNHELLFKQAQMERNVDRAIAYLEKSYEKNPYDYQVMKALAEGSLYKRDFEKSYFYADRLFHIFPYNKQHQIVLEKILDQSYENHAIPTEKFNNLKRQLQDEIKKKNARIHPFYQYINRQLDY